MKIHIIGCSGSGKTYLANALSKKYNIFHFDLDDIQWDNNAKEYGKKRTLDERNSLGIHHHNRYNAYCLADDIMEPYRPYVVL